MRIRCESEAQTVMFVAVDGKAAGLIGVADPIKPSTADAIKGLHAQLIKVVMLTGDNRNDRRVGCAETWDRSG